MEIKFKIEYHSNNRNLDLCSSSNQSRLLNNQNYVCNATTFCGILFDSIKEICDLNKTKKISESSKFIKLDFDDIPVKKVNDKKTAIIYFSNNVQYIGSISNDQLDGHGEIYIDDKKYYEGEFKNNLFHGRGKIHSNFGDIYDGDFIDGYAEGYGSVDWPNGSSYIGEIRENLLEGPGRYKYLFGSYDGYFIKGLKSGIGRLKKVFSDGNILEILNTHWCHDIPIGKGSIIYNFKSYHYEGDIGSCFVNNTDICVYPHGVGKLLNNGKVFYKGGFFNGYRHGFGKEYYKNEEYIKYRGHFFADKYSGSGQFYSKDGIHLYDGEFLDNKKHGMVTIISNFKNVEIANFKFDKRFGKSITTSSDHKTIINYYNNDEIVSIKINKLKELNLSESDKCPITHNNFKKNDIITILPKCGHTFHSESLFEWIKKSETCPMCRCNNIFEKPKKRKLSK